MQELSGDVTSWIDPVVLEGAIVTLAPLAEDHFGHLLDIGGDAATWRWMPEAGDTPEGMRAWVDAAMTASTNGTQRPFVTIERGSGSIVGSTRYLAIEPTHRRVEIGSTWLAPQARGRGINDEAKLLLLEHAFAVVGCQRVEFKTDARNERSRGALLGIGAHFEGIARKHMLSHGGRVRDSAWYSVIDDEWPATRERLRARVERQAATPGI